MAALPAEPEPEEPETALPAEPTLLGSVQPGPFPIRIPFTSLQFCDQYWMAKAETKSTETAAASAAASAASAAASAASAAMAGANKQIFGEIREQDETLTPNPLETDQSIIGRVPGIGDYSMTTFFTLPKVQLGTPWYVGHEGSSLKVIYRNDGQATLRTITGWVEETQPVKHGRLLCALIHEKTSVLGFQDQTLVGIDADQDAALTLPGGYSSLCYCEEYLFCAKQNEIHVYKTGKHFYTRKVEGTPVFAQRHVQHGYIFYHIDTHYFVWDFFSYEKEYLDMLWIRHWLLPDAVHAKLPNSTLLHLLEPKRLNFVDPLNNHIHNQHFLGWVKTRLESRLPRAEATTASDDPVTLAIEVFFLSVHKFNRASLQKLLELLPNVVNLKFHVPQRTQLEKKWFPGDHPDQELFSLYDLCSMNPFNIHRQEMLEVLGQRPLPPSKRQRPNAELRTALNTLLFKLRF
jgi:hypothetical protein